MNSIIRRRLVKRWRQQRINNDRRLLRDSADPLSFDDNLFVQTYKVTKKVFSRLCVILTDLLVSPQRCTSISVEIKILTTLNFLASGKFQKPVGNGRIVPVSQATASRCIAEVVDALNILLPSYVKFPTTAQEREKTKQGFYEKFKMPDVLGCIDGTLVSILVPRSHPNEGDFFSLKGYHAINTIIICDSDLKIIGVCAEHGGAVNDTVIWRSWSMSNYLQEEYNNGNIGWLLGDSGYPQQPWLMTPVLNATENTPEAYYTNMHKQAWTCIERCIGHLKSRWRCLSHDRVLHYEPSKCTKIINACTVLYNLCLNDGILVDSIVDTNETPYDDLESMPIDSYDEDESRQHYIEYLWHNRVQ